MRDPNHRWRSKEDYEEFRREIQYSGGEEADWQEFLKKTPKFMTEAELEEDRLASEERRRRGEAPAMAKLAERRRLRLAAEKKRLAEEQEREKQEVAEKKRLAEEQERKKRDAEEEERKKREAAEKKRLAEEEESKKREAAEEKRLAEAQERKKQEAAEEEERKEREAARPVDKAVLNTTIEGVVFENLSAEMRRLMTISLAQTFALAGGFSIEQVEVGLTGGSVKVKSIVRAKPGQTLVDVTAPDKESIVVAVAAVPGIGYAAPCLEKILATPPLAELFSNGQGMATKRPKEVAVQAEDMKAIFQKASKDQKADRLFVMLMINKGLPEHTNDIFQNAAEDLKSDPEVVETAIKRSVRDLIKDIFGKAGKRVRAIKNVVMLATNRGIPEHTNDICQNAAGDLKSDPEVVETAINKSIPNLIKDIFCGAGKRIRAIKNVMMLATNRGIPEHTNDIFQNAAADLKSDPEVAATAINKSIPNLIKDIFCGAGKRVRAIKNVVMLATNRGIPEHTNDIFQNAAEDLKSDPEVVETAINKSISNLIKDIFCGAGKRSRAIKNVAMLAMKRGAPEHTCDIFQKIEGNLKSDEEVVETAFENSIPEHIIHIYMATDEDLKSDSDLATIAIEKSAPRHATELMRLVQEHIGHDPAIFHAYVATLAYSLTLNIFGVVLHVVGIFGMMLNIGGMCVFVHDQGDVAILLSTISAYFVAKSFGFKFMFGLATVIGPMFVGIGTFLATPGKLRTHVPDGNVGIANYVPNYVPVFLIAAVGFGIAVLDTVHFPLCHQFLAMIFFLIAPLAAAYVLLSNQGEDDDLIWLLLFTLFFAPWLVLAVAFFCWGNFGCTDLISFGGRIDCAEHGYNRVLIELSLGLCTSGLFAICSKPLYTFFYFSFAWVAVSIAALMAVGVIDLKNRVTGSILLSLSCCTGPGEALPIACSPGTNDQIHESHSSMLSFLPGPAMLCLAICSAVAALKVRGDCAETRTNFCDNDEDSSQSDVSAETLLTSSSTSRKDV